MDPKNLLTIERYQKYFILSYQLRCTHKSWNFHSIGVFLIDRLSDPLLGAGLILFREKNENGEVVMS
jgi:hypothetical protein